MMRSLFAGVSGLRVHQTRMDVIGNNIANVNTPGFKKSRVTFQEMLNQTIRGASSPQGNRGGTNPTQIGLGVNLGSIDVIHSPGSPQSTGKTMDMAIEGEGYFIVGEGANKFYTRSGNFDFDQSNTLTTPNGLKVMGYVRQLGQTGITVSPGNETVIDLSDWADNSVAGATNLVKIGKNLDTRSALTPMMASAPSWKASDMPSGSGDPLVIDLGPVFQDGIVLTDDTTPTANTVTLSHNDDTFIKGTDAYRFNRITGNLEIYDKSLLGGLNALSGNVTVQTPSASVAVPSHTTPITVYDENGDPHELVVQMRKIAEEPSFKWTADVFVKGQELVGATIVDGYKKVAANHILEFDGAGNIINGKTLQNIQRSLTGDRNIDLDIDFSQLTQLAQDTTALALGQDGFEPGSLQGISVDTTGTIIGTFSNGQNLALAQVAVATFSNPAGLNKIGNTLFKDSKNSGDPQPGTPGTAGRGVIKPETLEMSNVDLSQEFVDMIVTQRGFQANSRIITTSDEMLQELVNLRR
ncbi:MAG: flagellar hook protein FlgE [Bacillota bacterium]